MKTKEYYSIFLKVIEKYSLVLFCIVTFLLMIFHIPFYDEAHAFDISCLKLKEILYLTRIEGHTILWYIILKITNNIQLYPYPMLITNWLFGILSIFLLWKKAPFNLLCKFFITFSTPFLLYFPIIARCYTLSIFLLFLICIYYKKRFKHPVVYSFLIFLCANTNVLALIGCIWFGFVYLVEIRKKLVKKDLIFVYFIAILSFLSIFIQFIDARNPYVRGLIAIPENIISYLFFFLVGLLVIYVLLYLFIKYKKALVYFLGINLTLTYLFLNIYYGNFWNHYFYFVYFIVLFWIFSKILLSNKVINVLFSTILFLSIIPYSFHTNGRLGIIYSDNSNKIAKNIESNPLYKDANLYCIDTMNTICTSTNTYLAKKNISMFDVAHNKRRSFAALANLFYLENKKFDFDEFFDGIINKKKPTYIFTVNFFKEREFNNIVLMQTNLKDFFIKTKKHNYILKEIEDNKLYKYKVYEFILGN